MKSRPDRREKPAGADVMAADMHRRVALHGQRDTNVASLGLLLLLSAAFLLKLIVVLQLHDHPLLQPDVGLDTQAYAELSRRVLAGDIWLGPALYYVSPLYIYFLAAGLALTDSFTAVRIVQALLGTASVAFVFLCARTWFGERAAWMAGGVAALTGLFTFYEALILQGAIDPVLTSGALLLVTRALTAERTGRVPWWLLAGAAFGVAALNRPNMAFGLAGIAAALLVARRVRPLALVVAGALVAVLPVAARNLAVSNQWSLSSSHGGLNFYIGNSAAATGFFNPVPGITPNIKGQAEDARQVAAKALGHPVSDTEASEYFSGLAWAWIRQHPGDALALFARKLGYVFSAHHVALPHSYPFYAYDVGTILRFLAIGPWILIPLGVAGLVCFAPAARREDYWIWLAFVPAYAVGVAAFFVAERYRLPLLVPLCIGSGAAIDGVLRAWAARRGSSLAVPAGVFAALALFANRPLPLHDGRWEEGLRLAEHFVTIGRYDEAERWAAALESNAPRPGLADYGVGVQLRAAKQDARAVPLLRRAYEAGIPQSGIELADTLLKLGRLAMQAKSPEDGARFFKEAVSIAPDQAAARLQYGLSLLVLDRCEQAASELAEAARLDPRDAEAPAHLAYCEAKLGRLDDARAHADAALALDPNHALARQMKAALAARSR